MPHAGFDAAPGAATIGALYRCAAPAAPLLRPPAAPDRSAAPAGAFTERQFRDALAQFATGVTVIAARRPDGRYAGFTANSFNSVSLDPPLVVWSLNRRAESLAAYEKAERYAINVLAHDQIELARRFSRPHTDRFDGVAFRLGAADAPLIEGCIAWFECRHYAQHRFVAVTNSHRRQQPGRPYRRHRGLHEPRAGAWQARRQTI